MPSPEHTAGFAESLPLCCPRGGDGVACGGCQRGATLLAAADRCGSARRGNGRHSQVHPQGRVEMVTSRFVFKQKNSNNHLQTVVII